MTIPRAVKDFLRYCQVSRNLSGYTVRNYKHYLATFAQWAESIGLKNIDRLERDDVLEFQLFLGEQKPPVGKKTQNYYLIALRALLKYLGEEKINVLSPEKITLAKTGESPIHFLDDEEMVKLQQATAQTTLSQKRDKAIVAVLLSTGMRVSELISLKRNQVSLVTGEFSIRGKGGKVRPVFLSDEALETLADYAEERADTNPYLFIRHYTNPKLDSRKEPLSVRTIQRLIRALARQAGLTKPVTPHKLRHSFATDLLKNGADLRSVQALLGHASVATTQVYTHVTDKTLKEAHRKFHRVERSSSP